MNSKHIQLMFLWGALTLPYTAHATQVRGEKHLLNDSEVDSIAPNTDANVFGHVRMLKRASMCPLWLLR